MSNTVSPLQVIEYRTGYMMPGNISYVNAIIRFNQVASQYQAHINATFLTHVSYVSFDIPVCATDVIVECVADSEAGMTNKTCNSVVDYDLGPPSILAGRLYVHVNGMNTCNGAINVTFMNTVLVSFPMTSRFIYDVSGIITSSTSFLDQVTAKNQYRGSGCIETDGISSLPLAQTQKQFLCVDQTIGCAVTNAITAVAPSDFSVAFAPCTATTPSVCIPLDGSASFQTGSATLLYKWEAIQGWVSETPIYDSTTCNAYTSGLFNSANAVSCFIALQPGLYKFKLTVYDNSTAISYDYVFVNVVPSNTPLVLPNETIGFYPLPPPRTDPPINRPIVTFAPRPSVPIYDGGGSGGGPPGSNNSSNITYINTTVASLLNKWPPLNTSGKISLLAIMMACAIFVVVYTGIYIAFMPNNETNHMDIIRYFNNNG